MAQENIDNLTMKQYLTFFNILGVTRAAAMLRVFPITLTGAAKRFRRFLDNKLKEGGRMWRSIKKGPYKRPTIANLENTIEQILEPFSKMTEAKEGELLESVYERLTTLVTIMDRNNVHPIQVSINTKFLNCQPEWHKYVTMVCHNQIGDKYQGELQGDSQKDKLTTTMMLLPRAIITKFFTPTNNHLRTSSNTRNQAMIQDGRVDIQTKNAGYGGNGNRNSGRQNRNQAFKMKSEATSRTKKMISCSIILMKMNIRRANCCSDHDGSNSTIDDNVDSEPSYDAKAVSEVNASNKVHAQVNHAKYKTIIHTSYDDQIDSNIIFDDLYVENNGGTSEHDSNAHDEYHNIQMLAYNVQREAKNKKRLNNELKNHKELLKRELKTFKDRVKTFE
nr:hypothetical protein [Tanacetum cinerariifolium]